MNKKTVKKSALSYLFLFIVIIGVMYLINVLNTKVNQLSYSEFIQKMENGELVEVKEIDYSQLWGLKDNIEEII